MTTVGTGGFGGLKKKLGSGGGGGSAGSWVGVGDGTGVGAGAAVSVGVGVGIGVFARTLETPSDSTMAKHVPTTSGVTVLFRATLQPPRHAQPTSDQNTVTSPLLRAKNTAKSRPIQ